MTVNFVMQHELHTSVEQFWAEIFRGEEFNRALYIDHLRFGYELELWNPATGRRRARVWPTNSIPKALAKVLGDKISFVEEGTCDDDLNRYDFRVIPSALPERIQVHGTVVTAPLGDRTCERTVTFEIEARVFGIGHAIESFLETTTRKQYEDNATFINEYLAAKR
jgi:hypothetical protein